MQDDAERTSMRALYRLHFSNPRRERLFASSVGFLLAFAIVRGLAHAIRSGIGPFGNVSPGGVHIHHLVWGIVLLLGVSYLWLLQIGTGVGSSRTWPSVLTAFAYGVASALTLDEFALWLHLEDVYWAHQGRTSLDAVVLFGALLTVGIWGGPFFHALGRETYRSSPLGRRRQR